VLLAASGAVGTIDTVGTVGTVGAVGVGGAVCGALLKGPVKGLRVSFKSETLGGGLKWIPRECPYLVLKNEAHMTTELDCPSSIDDCIAKCAWFDLEMGKGNWQLNVTTTLDADGSSIVLTPATDAEGCPLLDAAPTAARYLYGDWPVATLYNEDGFPALPFIVEVG
jgi:hypothetical protein